MKWNNENYCKELNLIPIKEIFVYTDVNCRHSCKVNFNSEYGIKIENNLYKIISLKRSKPMDISFNECFGCYSLSINNRRYYLNKYAIKNYLRFINKEENK